MCIYCIYFGLSLVELSLYTNRCCVKLCSYIQSNVPLFLLKEEETSSFFTLSNMSKPKIMNAPPRPPCPTPSLSNLKYNDVISPLRRCVRSSWWWGGATLSAHLGTFTYRFARGNLQIRMINVQLLLIVTLHCTHRIFTCALMRSWRDNRSSSVTDWRLLQLEFGVVLLLLLQKVTRIWAIIGACINASNLPVLNLKIIFLMLFDSTLALNAQFWYLMKIPPFFFCLVVCIIIIAASIRLTCEKPTALTWIFLFGPHRKVAWVTNEEKKFHIWI